MRMFLAFAIAVGIMTGLPARAQTFTSATQQSAATQPADYQPNPPKVNSITFFAPVMAQWASARGYYDYYRTTKDRPFAIGADEDPVRWQIDTLTKLVPGSAMPIDLLPDTSGSQAAIRQFTRYLKAANTNPQARVLPLIDIIQPRSASVAAREDAVVHFLKTILEQAGDDPHWLRLNEVPIIVDYHMGGLGPDSIGRISARLSAQGFRFHWICDFTANIDWAVFGKTDSEKLNKILQQSAGLYAFLPPLRLIDGDFNAFAQVDQTVAGFGQHRLLGVAVGGGHYSCRLSQRNYVDALGTARLRMSLDAALAMPRRPQFVSAQTWNDYQEGAHVEPFYKHTTALLEIIASSMRSLRGQADPDDSQPHLIVSYAKNIMAGCPIRIEVLNLPVSPVFETIDLKVALLGEDGNAVYQTQMTLDGKSRDAKTVEWTAPAELARTLLDVRIEALNSGGRIFHRTYRNLPQIPVLDVSDSQLIDPLTYSVPLHRLYSNSLVRLRTDGSGATANRTRLPRKRSVDVGASAPPVAGVSFMRSGIVINDPTSDSSQGVIDNMPGDPSWPTPPEAEYDGALVAFHNGEIAYAQGDFYTPDPNRRAWADWHFLREWQWPIVKIGADRLIDRSGRGLHGKLAKAEDKSGKAPAWVNLAPLLDALEFDGIASQVDLPITALPAGPMTLQLLIKPAEIGRPQALFIQGGDAASLAINSDGTLRLTRVNAQRRAVVINGTRVLTAGRWAHVAAVFDGAKIRLYVDGSPDGEADCIGLRSVEWVRFGSPQGSLGAFKGLLAILCGQQGASTAQQLLFDAEQLHGIYDPL